MQANSLALNGGTIQATDDSTGATLTHAAMTFANHKVDTEVTLASNLDQPDATEAITISATQSARFILIMDKGKEFDISAIALDVKTPSATLDVTVKLFDFERTSTNRPYREYIYSGSVATAGLQTFTFTGTSVTRFANVPGDADTVQFYFVSISGSGAGSVELVATDSEFRDTGGVSGIIFNHFGAQISGPQLRLSGHEGAIPELIYGDVVSSPPDGSAYAAGNRIDFLFVFTRPVDFPEGLVLPFWLGNGAEHRREARLLGESEKEYGYLLFAYTVQPGDMDIDGIYIGASPLGDNAGVDFHAVGESAVPAYLSLAANQLATSQSVDGSASRRCQEVFCSTVTASEEVGQFGMGLGLNPYEVESFLPFVQWGASRAWTFEYDSEEYSLDFIYTTFDDISSSY